jgi:hypothetical protein
MRWLGLPAIGGGGGGPPVGEEEGEEPKSTGESGQRRQKARRGGAGEWRKLARVCPGEQRRRGIYSGPYRRPLMGSKPPTASWPSPN